MANKNKLLVLIILIILSSLSYLLYGLGKNWQFAIEIRLFALGGIFVTGTAVAVATMTFHAIAVNRIITPSMLGLDNLYILGKTVLIFAFGISAVTTANILGQFIFSVVLMIVYALLLYYFFFSGKRQNIFFLLLVGFLFGILFESSSTFLGIALDPSEFQIAQDVRFVGFNKINPHILYITAICVVLIVLNIIRKVSYLDILQLGRDQAINLGLPYDKICRQLMIWVAILVALSTALVGPMIFLGLLIMNVTLQLFKTYKNKILVPAAILVSIFILIMGQFFVFHILKFKTELNVIINFVGGTYFIWLLLTENKKWQ